MHAFYGGDIQANRAGRRYITKKRYRLKEQAGILTEEERQEMENMKIFRKDRLKNLVRLKTNFFNLCLYPLQLHIEPIDSSEQ